MLLYMRARTELEPGVVRGEWHSPAAAGRVRCELCPRECTLQDGQRGFCFVRERRGDDVVLTSYGRASGFCIDPIEKKPLAHFFPGTSVLSFGTAGCNLGCRFCQNWSISKAREADRLTDRASPQRVAQAAREAGCKSIAFTYNDPVVFAEYAIDCAQAAREDGIQSVAVTAGYVGERARERFFAHIDAANVDLKAFTQDFYRKQCFAELQPVLDTLEYLARETQVWLEITTLLIPGHNDGEAEIDQLCTFVLERLGPAVPLHFTAFHPDFKLISAPPTPAATVLRAREQALRAGLHHVYTGNVHDQAGQSSYCSGCGALLIERDWYRLGAWHLRGGACARCGTPLAGRFDEQPGSWGARRARLRIHA
jgi:pyruvate formate lyase activating enzyme